MLLESLKTACANSPYFADHLPFVEELFSSAYERLIDLNLKILRYVLNQLQIRTELVLLSELRIEAKGDPLPVQICRKMGSLHFVAQHPAGSTRQSRDRSIRMLSQRPPKQFVRTGGGRGAPVVERS